MTDYPFILTLCTNVPAGKRVDPDFGHTWLQLEHQGLSVSTYGLFPTQQDRTGRPLPEFYRPGIRTDTDVQHNIELQKNVKSNYKIRQSRRWALTEDKTDEFRALVTERARYSRRDFNCADWAYSIVRKLSGIDFPSKMEPLAPAPHALSGKDTLALFMPATGEPWPVITYKGPQSENLPLGNGLSLTRHGEIIGTGLTVSPRLVSTPRMFESAMRKLDFVEAIRGMLRTPGDPTPGMLSLPSLNPPRKKSAGTAVSWGSVLAAGAFHAKAVLT